MDGYSYAELATHKANPILLPPCQCQLDHGSRDMCFTVLKNVAHHAYLSGRNTFNILGFDIDVVDEIVNYFRKNGLPDTVIVNQYYIQFNPDGDFDPL